MVILENIHPLVRVEDCYGMLIIFYNDPHIRILAQPAMLTRKLEN
jgi:hypothetical protein